MRTKDKKPYRVAATGCKIYAVVILIMLFFYGESFVVTLLGFIVAFLCAEKCASWAAEIKQNQSIAYLVGFLFALLGLLGYWIYYKNKKNNSKVGRGS